MSSNQNTPFFSPNASMGKINRFKPKGRSIQISRNACPAEDIESMVKYYALALNTSYWKPKDDCLGEIIGAIKQKVKDGDYVVVSEKALSIALGNIIDESRVQPSHNAKLIARFWMRLCWGYFLGVLCHIGRRLQRRLRAYPFENGSRHKQLALERAGLLQALMFGSEGGVDGSNLPYSYVSLPLGDTDGLAKEIHGQIRNRLGKDVTVIITDTDKTYSFRNFHFTPRPKPLKGIRSHGGIATYIAGRMLKLKKRPTPLAVAGRHLHVEEALKIANIADKARGPGAGATVWDMASRFKVPVTGVTWAMLDKTGHKAVVLVRKAEATG